MCLSVPGRVLAVDGTVARADFLGVERAVCLDLLDLPCGEPPVSVGDYLLQQSGFATERLLPAQAAESLALFDTILAHVAASAGG